MKEEEKKSKKKKYKGLRIFGKILLGLLIFVILLLLFVRSPWGQSIIIDKLISSVSKKTNTTIKLDKAFISFSGAINIDGLYIEDLSGDTLVYSQSLEADIPLWPIITGNGISINSLEWKGLTANVVREDSISGFNYQFLIDAYAPADTTTAAPTDTTTTKFNLGDLQFKDFDIDYRDEVSGMLANVNLSKLAVEVDEFDLEKMVFHIGEADLSGAKINFSQTKATPEKEDTTAAPTPIVVVDDLKINNLTANYKSVPDGIIAQVDLGTFFLNMPKMNLETKTIKIENLKLQDSEVLVKVEEAEIKKEEKIATEEKDSIFEWPDWKVSLAEVSMKNNEITYLVNGATPKKGNFNPEAIAISDLELQVENAFLEENSAGISFGALNFSEASGVNLKKFNFRGKVGKENLQVENLVLQLNESFLKGNLELSYASIQNFIEDPGKSQIEAELPELRIDAADAYIFQPELRNNEVFNSLATADIYGNVSVNGSLAEIHIPQLNLNWGGTTKITASGSVNNATEPENIRFNFPNFSFVSRRDDLVKFVEEDSLGISIPEKVQLSGSFQGTPDNISADANLILPDGKIFLNGSFKNQEALAFDANLEIEKLNLGEILQNEQLGEISLTLTAEGQGTDLNSLDAVLASNISKFEFNGYAFDSLEIEGKLKNGEGPISLNYQDYNLNMQMKALVDLDSVSPAVNLNLNLVGTDLQGLGISRRAIKTAFNLEAKFEGNLEKFDLASTISEGIVVYNNETYLAGDLIMNAHVTPDTTAARIKNKVVDLKLQSNSSPAAFGNALQQYFMSYISEKETIPDTIARPVNLELKANLSEAPILTEVLLPDLERLDTVNISVNFNQQARELNALVNSPFINYNGNEIDSLLIEINADKDNFEGALSFNAVNAGPVAINRTKLAGNIANDKLYLGFESYAQDSLLVNVQSTLNAENDSLYFHVEPEGLLLNGNKWNIPQDNSMAFAKEYLGINNFVLSRKNKELSLQSPGDDPSKEQLIVNVANFPLQSLIGFLNPEDPLATGALDGDIIIEELYGSTGTIANLEIKDFHVMSVPLGRLTLNAEAVGQETYTFNLALNDGDIDLDLDGNYTASEVAAELDLNLDLHRLELSAIADFTDDAITNTSGYISGNFQVDGTTADPVYEGAFEFNDAEFTVATLDAPFAISNESVKVDTTGFYFEDFRIEDNNSSGMLVNGKVITKSFTNPAFDLQIQAEDFQLINSTAEDNELVYGTAVVDVDISLEGDLNLPVINMNVDVLPETDLTYVLPGSELKVIEREGVVVFVNRENPDKILTRNKNETEVATIQGMILNANIDISKNSAFTLIIDQETGDNLRVLGEGTLNFSISETGRTNLAGRYELNDGHYKMNLYGLVTREFDIVPGSSISWFGDPLDAKLDISAVYKVETSASSLMATQISGVSDEQKGRFRQVLPFLVYLNVDGRLMQPKLSFGIDMPEEEQGSVGGKVYSRIQQLNEQENELNKQVFSLLVLNRFYPQSNSYGGEGGALTIARDNLNQAISDQLNMFSGELLQDTGIALNFGLNSYTDYQGESPQERTALEISAQKKFFDDRLVVEVGSEVNLQGEDPSAVKTNPLIGNVSIQYLLTEEGKFRLKGFRRNTFENIIDGQVIITGIALIFTEEFNEFAELWGKTEEEAEVQKKNNEDDQKEDENTSEKEEIEK